MDDTAGQPPVEPLYARFSRRLYALVLDWIIFLVVVFTAVFLCASVGSDGFARTFGIVVVVALLLYEPVLVSLAGGTIGHRLANLRVVDDGEGGNVSFLKALARGVIKSALGCFSFIVIMATRRSQALHDLWTRSTVQIRNPDKARSGHYVTARTELRAEGMPSRWRRSIVICGYILLATVLCFLVSAGLAVKGLLSPACLRASRCAVAENLLLNGVLLALFAVSIICIGMGWRGKLFGARRLL